MLQQTINNIVVPGTKLIRGVIVAWLVVTILQDPGVNLWAQAKKKTSRTPTKQKKAVTRKRETPKPKNFNDAFIEAYKRFQEIAPAKKSAAAAKTEKQKQPLLRQYLNNLRSTESALILATEMYNPAQFKDAEKATEARDRVFQARYLLAYVKTLMHHGYEAGILGEFVAKHYTTNNRIAFEAAYIALVAYKQEYESAPRDRNTTERALVVRVGQLIDQKWPDSFRADVVRMTLGGLYKADGQHEPAALWFSKVPAKSGQYYSAQLSAGQSMWRAYTSALKQGPEAGSKSDKLKSLLTQSQTHLVTGIKEFESQEQPPEKAPDLLIAGKATLAQIHLRQSKYQLALDLLIKGEFSVQNAIAIDDESKRPKQGVTSQQFASTAYELMLRSYVGTNQPAQAQSAMSELDKISSGSDGTRLTAVYLKLGKQLLEELNAAKGDVDRTKVLRESFVSFLTSIEKREQGQTVGSLMWVATTYEVFAENSRDDDTAREYRKKAVGAFEKIIERKRQDKKFTSEVVLVAVQMRLAQALRGRGDFDGAFQLLADILMKRPRLIDVQFEAATILQDWAAAEKNQKRFTEAIVGKTIKGKTNLVWGWARCALTLQRLAASMPPNAANRDRLLQAKYHLVRSRYGLAVLQSSSKKPQTGKNARRKVMLEIKSYAARAANLDGPWWDKLDKLYQTILVELDLPKKSLRSQEQSSTKK